MSRLQESRRLGLSMKYSPDAWSRRSLLSGAAAAAGLALFPRMSALASPPGAQKPMPLGFNTYCLRAMNWRDDQSIDFAVEQNLDAIFLQDSKDPRTRDPQHWKEVRARVQDLGLHLETGGGSVLPKTAEEFPAKVEDLKYQIKRAKALGSPLMRCLIAGNRAQLPEGPIEQHIETMVRLLRTVRSEAMDAGVKFAVEVHKDLQAWEFKMFLDEIGTEFVGIYLDTGNPVFVLEHPLTTVETLAPYAVTLHLRDSVVYEHPRGVALHWVPLGEGMLDFPRVMELARQHCPDVHVYAKPITGRPAEVIPYLEQDFWKSYPKARAADLARFLAMAKKGVPYARPIVNEDLQGRKWPDYLLPAIQHQQMDHMLRSLRYAKETLGLGVRAHS